MTANEVSVMTTRSLAVLIAAVYLLVSVDHLAVFLPVGEDEPWIAAAPYKLAAESVYGSDLFAGYYGSEEHLYQTKSPIRIILATPGM